MKHIELYENFGNMGMKPFQNSGRVYAACVQGDSFAAVGILDDKETQRLKRGISILEEPEMGLRLVDVTGMGYILHDEMGDFIAMPKSTNPDDYFYFITADGTIPYKHSSNENNEERLFEIPEGKLAVIDHHGHTELLSVNAFLQEYMGV